MDRGTDTTLLLENLQPLVSGFCGELLIQDSDKLFGIFASSLNTIEPRVMLQFLNTQCPADVRPVPVWLEMGNSNPFILNDNGKAVEKKIGKVRITYSTEDINRLLITMKTRFIWLSVGLSALSLLIFYFISRSLVAPVSQLALAARQVGRGDLELRVRTGSLPETSFPLKLMVS